MDDAVSTERAGTVNAISQSERSMPGGSARVINDPAEEQLPLSPFFEWDPWLAL